MIMSPVRAGKSVPRRIELSPTVNTLWPGGDMPHKSYVDKGRLLILFLTAKASTSFIPSIKQMTPR